jgi:hypothetical protein
MKKSIYIFLATFLSVLIFWGGSGVNAYFFCCDDCRTEKIITGTDCCSTSQNITLHNNDNACLYHRLAEGKCCGVDRIEFDWQSASGNQINLQPLSIDLDNSIFLSVHEAKSVADTLSLYRLLNRQSQKPPDLSKDDYFDLLCMLII